MAQVTLDSPSFLGQISSAIAGNTRQHIATLPEVRDNQLRGQATARKGDGLYTGSEEVCHEFRGFQAAAVPNAEGRIYERRIVQEDVAVSLGCAIMFRP